MGNKNNISRDFLDSNNLLGRIKILCKMSSKPIFID